MFGIFNRNSKKPIKACLGDKNTLYYNEELKCWVEHGKENEIQSNILAPPPKMFSTNSEKKFDSTNGNKLLAQSRYVVAGSFVKNNDSNGTQAPSLLPSKPGISSLSSPPSFFIPPVSQQQSSQQQIDDFRQINGTTIVDQFSHDQKQENILDSSLNFGLPGNTPKGLNSWDKKKKRYAEKIETESDSSGKSPNNFQNQVHRDFDFCESHNYNNEGLDNPYQITNHIGEGEMVDYENSRCWFEDDKEDNNDNMIFDKGVDDHLSPITNQHSSCPSFTHDIVNTEIVANGFYQSNSEQNYSSDNYYALQTINGEFERSSGELSNIVGEIGQARVDTNSNIIQVYGIEDSRTNKDYYNDHSSNSQQHTNITTPEDEEDITSKNTLNSEALNIFNMDINTNNLENYGHIENKGFSLNTMQLQTDAEAKYVQYKDDVGKENSRKEAKFGKFQFNVPFDDIDDINFVWNEKDLLESIRYSSKCLIPPDCFCNLNKAGLGKFFVDLRDLLEKLDGAGFDEELDKTRIETIRKLKEMSNVFGNLNDSYITLDLKSHHNPPSLTSLDRFFSEFSFNSEQRIRIACLEEKLDLQNKRIVELEQNIMEMREYEIESMKQKSSIEEKDKMISHLYLELKEKENLIQKSQDDIKLKEDEIKELLESLNTMEIDQQLHQNNIIQIPEEHKNSLLSHNYMTQICNLEEELVCKIEEIENLHIINEALEANQVHLHIHIEEIPSNLYHKVQNVAEEEEVEKVENLKFLISKIESLESRNHLLEKANNDADVVKFCLESEIEQKTMTTSNLEFENNNLKDEIESLRKELLKIENSFQIAFEVLGSAQFTAFCESKLIPKKD